MSSDSLQIIIEAIDQASGPIKAITSQIEKLQSTSAGLQNIGRNISNIGQSMTRNVTLPIAAVGVAALKASADFDSARVAVNTLGQDGNAMGQQMQRLAANLGNVQSSTQLLEGSYNVLSSMTPTLTQGTTAIAATTEIMRASAIGAAGGFAEVGAVADGTISILNAYGASANQAAQIVDKMAFVQNAGRVTIGQYNREIGKVAPLAAQAGIAIDEYNGFLINASLNGVVASQATTGYVQALSAVMNPSSQAAKKAGELGIQFNAAALRGGGLAGILQQLRDRGQDTPETLIKLFGSVEAMNAILPSTGAGFANLTRNIGASAIASGDAQRAYAAASQSIKAKFTASVNKLTDAMIPIGDVIQRAAIPLMEFASQAISAFTSLPAPVQDFAVVLAGVAAAAGPLLVVIGSVVSAVGTIGTALGGLGALVSGGGALAGVASVITGIGAAIAGIGAGPLLAIGAGLAAAAFLVITNWKPISTFFQNLFSQIGEFLQPAITAIGQFASGFMSGLMPALGSAMPMLQMAGAAIGNMFTNITQMLGALWNAGVAVSQFVMQISQFTPLGMLIQAIGSAFSSAGMSASDFGSMAGSAIGNVVAAVGRVAAAAVGLVATFASVGSQIIETLSNLAGEAFAAGSRIVQSIADGISAGIGAVTQAASSVASAIASFLPHSPPKQGPLMDIMEVGSRITTFIAQGMEPNVVGNAMNAALSPADPGMMAIASGAGRAGMMQPAGASSTVINYNPTINMGGNQNEQGFKQLLNSHKDDLARMIQEMDRQKSRVAYS
ncbi:MAG: phage tail tape measure protein [Cyanobacteria bacterium CRU_2_1]|nr:phage tail tape measure protein [Cyanobacteria bacterium CRU_2_1]